MWSLDPADTSIPITQVTSDSPEMGGLTTPPTLFYSASTKSSPPSHIRLEHTEPLSMGPTHGDSDLLLRNSTRRSNHYTNEPEFSTRSFYRNFEHSRPNGILSTHSRSNPRPVVAPINLPNLRVLRVALHDMSARFTVMRMSTHPRAVNRVLAAAYYATEHDFSA